MLRTLIGLTVLAGLAMPAAAANIAFSGSVSALGGMAVDASCAPLPRRATVLPANSSGTSSLGSFTYGHTLCTNGGLGPFDGSFTVNYAADMFSGTFTGLATLASTPGVIAEAFTYTITGGTGRFLGGSGSFTGLGTIDPRTPPPVLALDFDGVLSLPAVPEPASWALLVTGFGLAGGVLRRQRAIAA